MGFWKNPADGIFYRDFIRYAEIDKVTDKILKSYCIEYKQEAIFYEITNTASGRKNRAVCFYASGKKDVFNKRYTRYTDGIKEAKEAIQDFKRQGINCYTIEKHGKNHFVVFAWIKSDYKIKKQKKHKRLLKRKNLLKNLVRKIIDKVYPDNQNINITINDNDRHYGGRAKVYQNKIYISPYNIQKYRIHDGYNNDSYYDNRGDKINPYILHNYKKCLRFIILHEIGHIYAFNKYRNCKNFSRFWTEKRGEKFADNFALKHLKEV